MVKIAEGFFNGYRIARIFDALLLPALFVVWYRANHSGAASASSGDVSHGPGLVLSAVLMLVAARAALKIEQAVRAPEAYRWDLERASRWLVLILVMALTVRFLG